MTLIMNINFDKLWMKLIETFANVRECTQPISYLRNLSRPQYDRLHEAKTFELNYKENKLKINNV